MHVAVRQQRLITALAIHGPRPRSYLVGLLWPESRESRAMESLRVSMHLVSRQVPGLLVNGGAELSLSDLVDVDLHRVRSCVRELSQTGLNGNAASSLNLLAMPSCSRAGTTIGCSLNRADCGRTGSTRSTSLPASRWRAATLRLPWKHRRQHWNLNRSMKVRSDFSSGLKGIRATMLPPFGPSKHIERSCTRTWALRRRRTFGGSSLTFCRRRAWRGGIGQVSNRQAGCLANGSPLRPLPPGREHN